ncbi:MAG: patatin-like phospholipase family protein [Deltaproteobacteria bacterium]|nr:patatin-like phospholipase family protein [Deltaproteobacteria bacterium]
MANYPPRLSPTEIKYLALEGGGGKGNAFVGALESLGHSSLNIIQNSGYRLTNIRGVSGASAGAITSLFLAAGFSPFELKTITALEDFNSFFDGPHPGRVFRIGGFRTEPNRDPAAALSTQLVEQFVALLRDVDGIRIAQHIVSHSRVRDLVRHLQEVNSLIEAILASHDLTSAASILRDLIPRVTRLSTTDITGSLTAVAEIFNAIPPTIFARLVQISFSSIRLLHIYSARNELRLIFSQLTFIFLFIRLFLRDETYRTLLNRDLQGTAQALVQDYGMMTGEEIYKFFRRWLAVARLRVNQPSQYQHYLAAANNDIPTCFANLKEIVESGSDSMLQRYRDANMTFAEFEREFQIKFAVTGSNLETLTSHVFSGATTPRFYVVDAVRISMSLPVAQVPNVI